MCCYCFGQSTLKIQSSSIKCCAPVLLRQFIYTFDTSVSLFFSKEKKILNM